MRRILITGANGFVGSALTNYLLRQPGQQVVAAIRRGDASLPAGTERLHVPDFRNPDQWRVAMAGVDAVIHTAARVHLLRDTSTDPLENYRRDNLDISRMIAEAATEAGVRRFVFLSSIHVNGRETIDEQFDEVMPPRIETPYAQSKLEAETALQVIADKTGMELVIVRPPLVYGSGVAGNFERLLRLVARGVPTPFALVKNQRSGIARDNLVDFLALCLDHPKAANELFVISDGDDFSTPDLIRTLARGMNRPARLIPVPVPVLKIGAQLAGRSEMFRQLCGSLVVNTAKARTLLNWQPPVSAMSALMTVAADYVNTRRIA